MKSPVAPLSNNAFTEIPSWMLILSTPIYIHTSRRPFKVLLTSLHLFSRSVIPALSLWALGTDHSIFPPQFYHGTFFPVLQGRQNTSPISFLSTFLSVTASLPLHVPHFTLSTLPLTASSSLQFHASLHLPHHILHNCSLSRNPCP